MASGSTIAEWPMVLSLRVPAATTQTVFSTARAFSRVCQCSILWSPLNQAAGTSRTSAPATASGAGLGQQHRHRVLRGGEDVRLRGVHDHDALLGRRGGVDVVEADAGPADDHEVGAGGEHLAGHRGGRADDEGVRPRHRAQQLLGGQAELHVDVVAGVAQLLQPGLGDLFGDEDACHRHRVCRVPGEMRKRPPPASGSHHGTASWGRPVAVPVELAVLEVGDDPDAWAAAGFDVVRLLVSWSALEPERGQIDEDYARSKVAEFVPYWRDTRQVQASWNSRFLQYIKFNWAKRLEGLQDVSTGHAKNKSPAGGGGQSLEASFRRITDRSWAE